MPLPNGEQPDSASQARGEAVSTSRPANAGTVADSMDPARADGSDPSVRGVHLGCPHGVQYTALLGQGAYADGKRLHVSQTSTLADALISIDQYAFGEDAERKNRLRLRLTEVLA